MLWIKRNLFLAVGGAVALALLIVGIVYAFGAIDRKATLSEELRQDEATLLKLYGMDPFPATTNVDAAVRETDRMKSAVSRMQKFFTAPPVERVTGMAFRTYRDNLLADLRKAAAAVPTALPSGTYAFSFEEQRMRVDLDPRTFPLIPEQMADVRAICDVLFESKVTPLVNIRRARVSENDEKSNNQSDYHHLQMMTNGATGAVISPYEVCFQGLSTELSMVVQKLAVSRYGMVLKAVQVDPIEVAGAGAAAGTAPGQPPRVRQNQRTPAPTADKGVTILNERRFQVSMLIYVVRAVPGAATGVPAPTARPPRQQRPRPAPAP